jgi:hypothetical protein
MPIRCIKFVSKKRQGGYGDRLIGMVAVSTVARILNVPFQYIWESEFMNLCTTNEFTATNESADVKLGLGNRPFSPELETQDLQTQWDGKTVTLEAVNLPIHKSLWKNPYLQDILKGRSFDTETLQSFQEIFSKYIQLKTPFTVSNYDCGLQIRVGDNYCMPHSMAECYIPTEQFTVLAQRMKSYLQQRGIKGSIYVTCDTFHVYKHFTALNDTDYTFVFRDRSDDIHFDWYNSTNRYREVLEDHYTLMNCKTIITGLRSNFGTCAAYSSPSCSEIVFYLSTWKEGCTVEYKAFDSKNVLILKEYKDHLTDGTQSSTVLVNTCAHS